MFDKQVYIERRNRLREKVGKGLILIPGNSESPMNYPENTYHFRQDSTFLYFFGLDIPNLFGLIDATTGKDYLFGDDVDIEDIIWMGPQKTVKELAETVGVEKTYHYGEVYSKINEGLWRGCRAHFLPAYRADNKLLLKNLLGIHTAKLPDYVSMEMLKAIVEMRSVKSEAEIAEIEKACDIGYKMHVTAMKMARPGVMEQEIAGTIEGIALAHGVGTSFPTILTQNGQTLHNHNHSFPLETGRLMIVDAGAESNNHYASDFTRTIPVGGKFSQKQLDIYNIVLAANNKATLLIKPGEKYLDIHLQVCDVIASGLKDLGLMKGNVQDAVANGAHAMFFPHGLGHMMGLDVHDMEDYGQIYIGYDDEVRPVDQFGTAYLRLGRRLQHGFVITNEPGIYFIPALIEKWQQEGINHDYINFDKVKEYLDFGGIRLEDDLLVTPTGGRLLGKRVPINPDEVEGIVQG
jgi:Xaa-Pro aminopeptidase